MTKSYIIDGGFLSRHQSMLAWQLAMAGSGQSFEIQQLIVIIEILKRGFAAFKTYNRSSKMSGKFVT